jgi:tetratricopeptide (TPR) repeat protein
MFALLLLGPLLLALGNAVLAADIALDQARQFIDRNNAKAAYELLIPLQTERAGDPDYDLLLGVAANESGRHSEAVFALERVLAVQPNNARARAEIARAYFALGERPTAKKEFETVQKQDVPADVTATIQKYLDAMARIESTERFNITGYAEVGIGHDTNVNSATAGNQIAVPVFGGALFTLAPSGVKLSDNFGSVGGGINLSYLATPDVTLFAGADLYKRINSKQDTFDTGSGAENFGVRYTRNKDSYSLAYQKQVFYVDNNLFRSAQGGIAQYQHAFNEANVFTAYVQYTPLEYAGQEIRNANRAVGGVAYAHALGGTRQPVIFLGAYVGNEKEKAPGVPQLGDQFWGLRVGGQFNLNEKLVPFFGASYEERRYGGPDPLFLVTRNDNQYDVRVGVTYIPAKLWSVTPQISYTRNDSNVIINQFDRAQALVTLRRDFR